MTATIKRYRDVFGDRCYGLAELSLGPEDRLQLARMRQQAEEAQIPLVAAGDVHYHIPGGGCCTTC